MSSKKRKHDKKTIWIDIAIVIIGVAILTPIFIHFGLFTKPSAFYEYTDAEKEINRKISENTRDCTFDADGNITLKKSLIDSDTLTYFDVEGHDFRILAYVTSSLEYRTAVDICENCYESGNQGWFYEVDGTLCCSVCGKSISLEEMGESGFGGVMPVAIPEAYREDRKSNLVIPKSLVDDIDSMISMWKSGNMSRLDEIHGD